MKKARSGKGHDTHKVRITTISFRVTEEEKEAFTRNALIHSISMTYNMDDKEMENIIPVIEQVTPLIINSWKTEN